MNFKKSTMALVLTGSLLMLSLAAGCAPKVQREDVPDPKYAQTAQTTAPQTEGVPTGKSILVKGEGVQQLKPDQVLLYLAVETEHANAAEAAAGNAETIKQLTEALIKAGVPEDRMETSGYSVYQDEKYGTSTTVFRVANRLKVRYDEVEKVGDLIDLAIKSGATSVQGVEFGIRDSQAAYEKALAAALEDAKTKAQFIAQSAGLQGELRIVSISQSGDIGLQPMGLYDMAKESAMAGTQLMPGDVDVHASLNVLFAYGD